ncbi:MAG: hypothetical protein IJZ63_04265 [Clostridia bacterium]|nr:hypothetical protein [Clostridia bacterium]
MSKLINDKVKKQIIAEAVAGSSSRAIAAKYGVSYTTVLRLIRKESDFKNKVEAQHAENTASVLAFMDSQKNDVCELIKKLLDAMNDPKKIANMSLVQLATTMGIVIDKYSAGESAVQSSVKENNLFEALNAVGEEGLDEIPEVQQASEADTHMVEDAEPQG